MIHRTTPLRLVLALALLPPPGLRAQLAARLDPVVDSAARSGRFAGVVLIRRAGSDLYARAVGDAVREFHVPHRRDTRFKYHSLTKPVTSVAFYALVADGLTSPDAPVCRYLDPCPAAWEPVRVAHLLNHSSGLPELENDWYERWEGDLSSTWQAIRRGRDDFALVSEPGAEFRYSNGGYTLLSYLVEVAAGRPFGDVLRARVFEPAGMTDAGLEATPDPSVSAWYRGPVQVERLANGYNGSPDEVRTAYSLMYTVPGAGGVHGTADDLARFAEAVFGGRLLPDALVRRMVRPGSASDAYADGWVVRDRFGRTTYAHSGGNNGFVSSLDHYPDLKLSVVLLSNLGFADLRGLADRLTEVVLEEIDAR